MMAVDGNVAEDFLFDVPYEDNVGATEHCALCLLVVPSLAAAQNIFSKPGQTVTLPCGSPKNNTTPATWIKDGFESEGCVAQFRDNNFANASQHPSYRGRVKLNRNKSLTMKKLTTADSGTYICETYWGGSFHNETVSLIIVHKEQNISNTTGQTVTLSCGSPKDSITDVTWIKGQVELNNRNKSLILKNVTVNDTETYQCKYYEEGEQHTEIYHLSVDPAGGDSEGRRHVGLAGVFVFVVGVVFVVVFVVVGFVVYKRHQKKKKHPPVCPDEAAVQQLV
ncbi:protein turtle homolog B-like [Parambassis ranga]|uniref:Protein turtle homolog B-like n=1 Tax=Parambassis ranga TaxID=210632 RepID=A0A6P7IH61_9TELE|nr:protein turtle homolog B-like [Parambassis ranga]